MLEHVFPGDSEMARRMRAFDWSRTPLGPVERWPASLRTSVSTCLDCAFPIVIWWGPDLAILYNDEYRPMLGAKHPGALGERGAKVWSEIWDVIGPMLSQVMERARATRSRDLLLHIDRHGYPEEAYFSFSYSPIHDEGGAVGGVFCPVIETTEKVIGERRLRTLRDLAAQCKGAETEARAYRSAAAILAENPHDVPFAMIYRVERDSGAALLEATAGIEPGGPVSPRRVPLGELDGPWSLARVAGAGRTAELRELSRRFDALPTGAWKAAPERALVLPVLLPGQERPRAILVVAASPMRALDEDYRTFFGLVATQIASALADAQALEEERRRAEALAQIDRAKTAFFSNVSHELRTPLTLMLGPIEDLLGDPHGPLRADVLETLGLAHRNAIRLLKLVNTLLDFSRIEAGRMDASYEPTDLAAFTAELASAFRSGTERAGLRLVVDCPPCPEPVWVDRDLWEKIVLNLLSNAFKFTFEGEIAVALRWRGERVELSVRDTGVGIPKAALPQMFQRFHRVKNSRSRTHEGTGIGLALVQELAKLHGGEAAVESTEGVGTTFTVSIPTGRAHLPAERLRAARELASTSLGASWFVEEALRWLPGEEAAAPEGRESVGDVPDVPLAAACASGERPARVLVADDNADMRHYLRRLLARSYAVETVADGSAALERIRSDPPDLLLSDVMMPGLDGFALLAALRADERTRAVPVILLSARAGEESRIEGLQAGADAYLTKPFSARELLAQVSAQLQLARLRRDADRRKDQFVATLAHELRNPLAPLANSLELLKHAGGTDPIATGALAIMERQIAQMARLLDDLLDVSRITHDRLELRKARVELAAVVEQALETARPLADRAGHALHVALPAEPVTLHADPVRLTQVLGNLLNNACKYTPPRGRVRLTAAVEGGHVAVSVEDTGIGIPPDRLASVFELFSQLPPAVDQSQGGLGIGLTLVKRLVEMHGGSVEARSEGPGRGSRFVVRLPLVGAALPSEAPAPEALRDDVAGRRILIVDDNRDAAASLALLLQRFGCETHTACDGLEAVEAAERVLPDVVLLDLGMPRLDGLQACRRIRATPWGRDALILAMTGWGQDADRQRSREAGFDGHLVKPVDYAALLKALSGRPARA